MTDSDITYVKLEPPIEAPAAPSHFRESRIENLPLTIPGNVTLEGNENDKTESIRNIAALDEDLADSDLTLPESSNLSEITALPEAALPENTTDDKAEPAEIKPEIDLPEDTTVPEITAIETVPDGTVLTDKTESTELLEAHGSDVSDAVPSETNQSERRGRTYDSIETTDIFEEATEKYATELPEIVAPKKKLPKFIPKLSYFQKPQVFVSFPTNSIEKTARRKFRSHCRCEKIWNCPKLQITVPRCPDEYFLCCF